MSAAWTEPAVALAVLVAWAFVRAPGLGRGRGGALVVAAVVLAPSAGLNVVAGVALAEAALASGRCRAAWVYGGVSVATLLHPDALGAAALVLVVTTAPARWRSLGAWRPLALGAACLAGAALLAGLSSAWRAAPPLAAAARPASALGLCVLLAAAWLAHGSGVSRRLGAAVAIAGVSVVAAPDLTFAAALVLVVEAARSHAWGPRVAVGSVVAALAASGALTAWEARPDGRLRAWADRHRACAASESAAPACVAAVIEAPVYDDRAVAVRPFFGPGLLGLREQMRVTERVTAAAVGLRRRPEPTPIQRARLGVSEYYLGELPVHLERVVPFERSLRHDALIELDLSVEGTWLTPPELSARAVGPAYRGPVTRAPLRHGRQRVYVPVDPRAAAWRWSALSSGGTYVARGVAVSLIGSGTRARSAELTVHAAYALTPPADARPTDCATRERLTLEGGLLDGDARPTDEGFVLQAGRVSFVVPACPGTCFYGELGVDTDAEAHAQVVVEGRGPTRIASRRTIGPGWRQPVVADLDGDGQPLVIRLETDAPLRVYWPRLRRCAGSFSIVHALHEGEYEVTPDALPHELIGDELRLPIAARAAPRPRVEIPFELPSDARDACLALELDAREHDPTVALLVGLRRGRRVYWLARHAHEPGGPRVILRDLPIGRFAGRPSALVLSTWAYGEAGGTALFIRPRTHRCGQEPWWMF